jgi:GT2 family glycosyltransferase
MMKQRFPNVNSLKTRITGFRGNNTGVAIAKGEYICILNPDTGCRRYFIKSTGFERQKRPELVLN